MASEEEKGPYVSQPSGQTLELEADTGALKQHSGSPGLLVTFDAQGRTVTTHTLGGISKAEVLAALSFALLMHTREIPERWRGPWTRALKPLLGLVESDFGLRMKPGR